MDADVGVGVITRARANDARVGTTTTPGTSRASVARVVERAHAREDAREEAETPPPTASVRARASDDDEDACIVASRSDASEGRAGRGTRGVADARARAMTTPSEREARARAKSDVAALARSPGRARKRDDDEFSFRPFSSVRASDDDDDDDEDEDEDEDEATTSTRTSASVVIERARAAARAAVAAADALSPKRNDDETTTTTRAATPPHLRLAHATPPRARGIFATSPSPSPNGARRTSTLGPARRVAARPAPVRAPTERERRDAARRVVDSARSVAATSTKVVDDRGAHFRVFTNARDRASVDRPRAERTYRRTEERESDESTLRKLLRIAALADRRDPPPRRRAESGRFGDVKEAVGFLSSPNKVRAARPRL